MVNDMDRKICACMTVFMAVKDRLGSVPNGPGDDGVMVVRLEIFILFPLFFLAL